MVREFASWMEDLDNRVPIHMQEPLRRDYCKNFNPITLHFFRDASGSKIGGAAGWCLHNGSDKRVVPEGRPYRCFNMTPYEGRLYSQWDWVERLVSGNAGMYKGVFYKIGGTDVNAYRYHLEFPEQLGYCQNCVGNVHWDFFSGWGWATDVESYPQGFLNRGPFIRTLDPGFYKVTWRMLMRYNTDNSNDHPEYAVTIDVRDNDTGQVLVERDILAYDLYPLNKYKEFSVFFNYKTPGHSLEFRTYWHDRAFIKVDFIDVIPMSISQPVLQPVFQPVFQSISQ